VTEADLLSKPLSLISETTSGLNCLELISDQGECEKDAPVTQMSLYAGAFMCIMELD